MNSSEGSDDVMTEGEEEELNQRARSLTMGLGAPRSGSLKKMQTLNRRATVFGDALDEGKKVYTKSRADLKRIHQLQMIEYKTIGKSRQYELVAETSQNMLIRFLLHFLFTEHDFRTIDLFDEADWIFLQLKNVKK